MQNLLKDAFKELRLLEQDFALDSVNQERIDEIERYIKNDDVEVPEEEIIDVEANNEDELADNYVGKVILECDCCHSRIYKDAEDVVIDAKAELANVDEECPVCNSECGYHIIGKIVDFENGDIKKEEPEEDEEEAEDDIEIEDEKEADEEEAEEESDEEEVKEESLKEAASIEDRVARKHLKKVDEIFDLGRTNINIDAKGFGGSGNDVDVLGGKNPLNDSLEGGDEVDPDPCGKKDEDLNQEEQEEFNELENRPVWSKEAHERWKELRNKRDSKVEGRQKKEEINEAIELDADGEDHLEVEKHDDGTMEIKIGGEPSNGEAVAPMNDEDIEKLDVENQPEEEQEIEEPEVEPVEEEPIEEPAVEEEPAEEGEEEVKEEGLMVNDFDEKKFDKLAESYLHKVYDNVDSFGTTSVKQSKDAFIIEGVINFKSGKFVKSQFVFTESRISRRGKLVMEGYNTTFSKSKKAFMLTGSFDGQEYISESMIYNYTAKQLNESNKQETVKVYGRVHA